MFYDTSCFPFTKSLEDKWADILAEYQNISSGTFPYVETDMYTGEWEVFPFIFFGEKLEDSCKMCPKTWDLMKDIPGLMSASFSVMRPSTEILPHTGFTKKAVRFQLPLIVPKQRDRAALIVGDVIKRWDYGQSFAFDDTVWHSCHNRSDETRVVLIIDVERTAYDPVNEGTPPGTFSYGGGLPT